MADVLLVLRSRQDRQIADARNSWRFRDLQNPFELSENAFRERFRLSRQAVRMLIEDLQPHINIGVNGYSIEMQVLTALRLFGTGSFQNVVADGVLHQISQPSASRFLQNVTKALNAIASTFISFPTETEEVLNTCREFNDSLGFPNVIGAIDGSHFYINRPNASDYYVYINRKSRFSISVQMVCDANKRILDVVSQWPGSTHDSYIWNNCGLKRFLSSGIISQRVFLLGDSGYPLEMQLMTPYCNPTSPPEILFNIKHKKARNIIERCFGLLKKRFRMFDETGGGKLLYDPITTTQMIIAAAVLHNICILANVPYDGIEDFDDDDYYPNDDDDDDNNNNHDSTTNLSARILRDEIAAR